MYIVRWYEIYLDDHLLNYIMSHHWSVQLKINIILYVDFNWKFLKMTFKEKILHHVQVEFNAEIQDYINI